MTVMRKFDLNVVERRKRRVRLRLKRSLRLRLSIFKSNKYFYAQLIDDDKSTTLVSASTLEPELKSIFNGRVNVKSAKATAKLIADRLREINLEKKIVFDRGSYKYTGIISEFANELRRCGFEF